MIDREDILKQLDADAENYIFPMLDNGYYYHGDQKLTIFRDKQRWAILLEVLAYNNHEDGLDGITTIANVYGNCLTGKNNNDNFHYFATDSIIEAFLPDETDFQSYLNPLAKTIKVREAEIPINFERKLYESKNIVLEDENKIKPWEFMRALIPEYSNLFWLKREDVATKIPLDLPVFMTLNNWNHPDLADNEIPSNTETFTQLADVIFTADKTLYNTTKANNTHWTNWPEGGAL